MMHRGSYRYRVVDVFTKEPLEGNQLAVFPDCSGIDDVTMQKIAKELNLAETTFVSPASRSDCAARVRIFTPAQEMRFAGHPTIGTSFVLMEEGIVPRDRMRFSLEEGVGAVPVRVEPGDRPMIWLLTPPIEFGKQCNAGLCARVLGLEESDLLGAVPEVVSAANPAVFIALKDKAAVDRALLDSQALRALKEKCEGNVFVFVFTPTKGGAYSRMFAPDQGVPEDPATGSATGPLAAYMMRHGLVASVTGTRFVSEQGVKMGRRSLLYVLVNGEQGTQGIEVGGYVTPLVEATMNLAAN